MAIVDQLLKLLDGPRDNALLRYSLGNEFLKAGDSLRAAEFFRSALDRDADYSAAWKMLGRALTESGNAQEALAAYRRGIEVAQGKGDIQAAKEMTVFARRIEKALAPKGADT